ncbi:DUF1772 domain-containing protein [Rhizobium sp. TRM95111]|uniref:anthrone oxygenase family protein n=1 Tax=Rhizobium alarense TaxID=2846851 RepID=UPI001F47605C|nr:anthrone oxygenase family protein [Rhizobium alarense]MCF3641218.1 DUF1772 domain-containing protein [Rhizobium alarense]
MATIVGPLTFAAAIGAGLNAGLFFIFSVCIMAAFARLPAADGIAAMNAINVVIQNPLFFLAFFGTALAALVLVAVGFLQGGPAAMPLIAAGLVFLVGVIGVTVAVNVPLNDALAAAAPGSADAAALWQRYLSVWTLWNHVRTVASILSLGLFVLAYRLA